MDKATSKGIYIHLPFCKKRCSYCAFYSQTSFVEHKQYIDTLLKEARLNANFLPDNNINTIYIGGGTPSQVPPEHIILLLNELSKLFNLDKCKEITIEVNPDDINKEWIEVIKSSPINRISVGIQSFDDEELKIINRRHDSTSAKHCLELIATNFNNFSLDLMYGLPMQTFESWEKSIEQALAFNPNHISAYSLSLEPDTSLAKMVNSGKIRLNDEDFSIECYRMLNAMLRARGYEHYEVSNYCKKGFHAIHNSNYWLDYPYIGLGAAAHSYNGKIRKWNIASVEEYMTAIRNGEDYSEEEVLDASTRYNEYMMLGLRTNKGIRFDEVKKLFGDFYWQNTINVTKEIESKFIQSRDNEIILNEGGLLFADGIAARYFILE